MPRGASRALFAGNGQAAEFPFFFKVFEEDQLSVLITSPSGATAPAKGWTAELDESGGTVRYLHNGAPLPEGWKLAIVRDMPFVQEVDLITGTRFDPEVIETALDVATAERQQLLERLGRAVVVEPTDEAGPEALLADIRNARSTAVDSASSAQANANAAANSAQAAAGNAAIATEAREAACVCAGEAKAARDAAIAQTEAANTLMEAELAKVNAIVAANRTDQEAAVTAARAWAEKAPETPVEYDGEGNPLYSARHWAENAQKIAIEPPTAERRGAVRVGAGLHLEEGENGETDVLAVSVAELGGNLLLNSEEWITESGEWKAPVTGWYEVLVINGGCGGYISSNQNYYYAGASGGTKEALTYLAEGTPVQCIVGAGGPGVIGPDNSGVFGGITSFGDYVTADDSTRMAPPGISFGPTVATMQAVMNGAGPGGGSRSVTSTYFGAGGAAAPRFESTAPAIAGNGYQGAIRLRFWNPARAGGPERAPATFAARRKAPRAALAPSTVNLYDPETWQGSVWREEDAQAKLAEGLVTQEAWEEIRQARAAEAYAAWLADPETEAERFQMLRAARKVKLARYDVTVAELRRKERAGADVTAALAAWDAYAEDLCDLPAREGAPWDGGGELTPWPELSPEEAVHGALAPAQPGWRGEAPCA